MKAGKTRRHKGFCGRGTKADLWEKLFDPFFQVKGGLSEKSPGTGLGLTIVKQLIEMYDGKIWVESGGLGNGCRFSFCIPIRNTGI